MLCLRKVHEVSTEHIKTKHKLKDMADVRSFEALLRVGMLADSDKQLLRMHYVQGFDFNYIADSLGYSESYVKKRHKNALRKLNKLL